MTEGMKQWLVPTSCLGCAISITAFKRGDTIWDDSIYICTLSDHTHLYYNSWRGRLRLAWRALKGDYPQDIGLDLPEDIAAFRKAMDEVYVWLNTDRHEKITDQEKSNIFQEQQSSGRIMVHLLECDEAHKHQAPGCCRKDCWCRS